MTTWAWARLVKPVLVQALVLATPASDLESRLCVEPIDPLVIDHPPFLAQF